MPKSLAFVSTANSCQVFWAPGEAGLRTIPTTTPLPLRCELGGAVPPTGGLEVTAPPDGGTGVGGAMGVLTVGGVRCARYSGVRSVDVIGSGTTEDGE